MIFKIYLLTSRQWIRRQYKSSPTDGMMRGRQCEDEPRKRVQMIADSVKKLGKRGVRGDGEEKWPTDPVRGWASCKKKKEKRKHRVDQGLGDELGDDGRTRRWWREMTVRSWRVRRVVWGEWGLIRLPALYIIHIEPAQIRLNQAYYMECFFII
jgi:hypothetical protein